MKDKTLYMIGNAHIDPVWLWQWPEGFHEVKATFRSALDRMNEYGEFVFASSSALFYEWVEKSDPKMFAEIQQRVAEGRWQIVGGWWIEPDCNLPGGESFVRQGLYGQRYFQEKFGRFARVGYNVDSFGHHGMLPQILKKSGLDTYVFLRPMPHEKGLPDRLFWWEADDGSRVLAYRIPYEYCTWGKDLEEHIRRCVAEIKPPFEAGLCFYGVGNHGGGPTRENLESIRRLQQLPNDLGGESAGEAGPTNGDHLPRLLLSSPEAFFENVCSDSLPIPVIHDDLQHHASGCYAAHSGIKRWNRRAENILVTAEKLSAIAAWTTGQPYPTDLGQAWKNVLFNQFHDVLAGTSLEAAYEDARDLHGEAMSIAGRGLNYALQSLLWDIHIEPEDGMQPLVVFNPHAWPVQANVELESRSLKETETLIDEAGHGVPVQRVQPQATANGRQRLSFIADLPPMGYRTYRIVQKELHPQDETTETIQFQAGDHFMENSRFRLEFDTKNGAICSLYDRLEGIEVLAGPAALPVLLDDPSDTWSHNVYQYNQAIGSFKPTSIRLVEYGPVKAVIRVSSEYGASRLIQEFSMYQGLDQIDVQVSVDWREQFKALKLRFPLDLSHMKPISEVPYGHIQRLANGQEEPGQSWIDISGLSRQNGTPYGVSLLNDGKYSFDINIRDIGLTVLRSPIYAHHMPAVPDPQGHYAFIDQGQQRFRYAILPHSGSWEKAGTARRAAELNQPPLVLLATYHPEGRLPQSDTFLSVDQENIIASVLKKAEDNDDLILRCFETSKEATRATICLPKWQRAIEADFGPCEIKTFRIPKDHKLPVAETNLLEWDEK